MDKQLILDLNKEDLAAELKKLGQPGFRAKQILEGIFKHLYDDFSKFGNIPNVLKTELDTGFILDPVSLSESIVSKDKRTEKYLFEVQQANRIETVLMKYSDRNTVCVSTQVGCPMGCVFCSTGQMGFTRNLSSGEILGQILYVIRALEAKEEKLTNIVFMGMGEPFLNYPAVMRTIEHLTDPELLNFGARRITISTVGIIPRIKEFTALNSQVNLAVSLHAPENELRSKLVPANRMHPLKSLITACREYTDKTRRRITFEYALIDGVNDSDNQAKQLISLIKGMLCHVNLIALNPSKEYPLPGSSRERVDTFAKILTDYGIPNSIRLRRGIEINAGCGQLAQSQQSE
ncbi:MAG: 23S rRNA (adenine(2503)-C(2))-methyltransferase RlmN [Anaerolineaceae bacterium]|jgi:23S rRNA (adenine2503-C2)-methyltransferase|nr:23S rRNA (adenine(2503)-C(2))-methyltransferase RlmN [Anaerolineaceae bacterium]MDD4041954.1 23S rRNA (adenine(2503)-C(2))-methyltransferase RlmN [Anaerolineaceae bacterium]